MDAAFNERLEKAQAEAEAAAEAGEPMPSFRDLLGPGCVVKRVDKDQRVLCHAKPEEMQEELLTRAAAQKRIGACADYVKDMARSDKLQWALELKEQANEFYSASDFEEAARLYNDCLVALDLDGTEEENSEVANKLQLPVCTNLAACMIEMGRYARCVEICDIALSVDPCCAKALYRRGLARYRTGEHRLALPDLEAALAEIRRQRELGPAGEEGVRSDLERRILVYLGHIRRFSSQEKARCQRIFAEERQGLYADRPEPGRHPTVDDSDEAIEAALAARRGTWCPCCRRSAGKAKTS